MEATTPTGNHARGPGPPRVRRDARPLSAAAKREADGKRCTGCHRSGMRTARPNATPVPAGMGPCSRRLPRSPCCAGDTSIRRCSRSTRCSSRTATTRARGRRRARRRAPYGHVPMHARLAAIVAEWKRGGLAETIGRGPAPDDLIVPLPPDLAEARRSREGEPNRTGARSTCRRWAGGRQRCTK